jgi:hypothetical protein
VEFIIEATTGLLRPVRTGLRRHQRTEEATMNTSKGTAISVGQLALLSAAVFAGTAFYINVVEQPARLGLDDQSMLSEWKPAYKRGSAMQAPLAVVGCLLGLAAWRRTGHTGWALGALLMIANWPVTFLAIMPTNNKLMRIEASAAGPESRAMIERWGLLHAVRTALGGAACMAFLWASLF